MNFADSEADGAALICAKELVFTEGRDAVDFESGAEAKEDVVEREASKPLGDSAQGSGGDDGGTVGDGVVRKAAGRITNDNLLLEEDAEPFSSVLVGFGEGEGARGEFAGIGWEGDG